MYLHFLLRMKTINILLYFIIVLTTSKCAEENNRDKCRGKLSSCLSGLLPGSQTSGLPSSKEQINKLCSIYKKGNQCINSWVMECLPTERKKMFFEQRKGAMLLMKLLCDDHTFQNDYLNHTSCYENISEDWNRCMNNFQMTIRGAADFNETDKNESFLCCAKYGFNKCVSFASKAKCDRSAAIMLRRISETLSADTIMKNKCEAFDVQSECGNCSENITMWKTVLLFTIFIIYFNVKN